MYGSSLGLPSAPASHRSVSSSGPGTTSMRRRLSSGGDATPTFSRVLGFGDQQTLLQPPQRQRSGPVSIPEMQCLGGQGVVRSCKGMEWCGLLQA